MESNEIVYSGESFYKNTRDVTYVTGNRAGERTFTVWNGKVKGVDRIKPNPIEFLIESSYCAHNERKLMVRQGPDEGRMSHWYGHSMGISPLHVGFNHSTMFGQADAQYAALYDRAFAKIFDQLRGNSETVVDLLEGAATLRMLKSAAKFVDGIGQILALVGYKVTRSGHRGQRALDYATQKWLEYRYGWTPLVNSVYSAFDNLAMQASNAIIPIVARSGSKSNSSRVISLSGNSFGSYPVEETTHRSARVLLSYNFDVGGMSRVGDWTSLNPATIAWELLPFSFVADWFVSIGDSLRNIENWWLYRNRFHSGFDTFTTYDIAHRNIPRTFRLFKPGDPGYDAWYAWEEINGSGYLLRKYKKRVVRTSLPVPRGPRFRLKIGTEKCLDAAALLQQLVGKRSRQWAHLPYTE